MPSYNSAALMGGRHLEKGSTEAKARMAYLRSLRGTRVASTRGGAICGGKRRTSRRGLMGRGFLTADMVFSILGKSLGFWKNWGTTNIGQLVSYIKNKKQRQKIIDLLKELPASELKKLQAKMRAMRDSGMTTEQILEAGPDAPVPKPPPPAVIQQVSPVEQAKQQALRELEEAKKERDKRLLEIIQKRYERAKIPKQRVIEETVEDDYDYDEHQPDNVQEIEDAVDDTQDMVSMRNPRTYRGGKMSGRDIMDIFLGPWGWAALTSRKIQEKKSKKQQAEMEKLMYGDN